LQERCIWNAGKEPFLPGSTTALSKNNIFKFYLFFTCFAASSLAQWHCKPVVISLSSIELTAIYLLSNQVQKSTHRLNYPASHFKLKIMQGPPRPLADIC
jgi:hypothetical protein